MKTTRKLFLFLPLLLALMLGAMGCGNDDEEEDVVDPVSADDVNVLLIQSKSGKSELATMYKIGESKTYEPPYCKIISAYSSSKMDSIYQYMAYWADFKGSDNYKNLRFSFVNGGPTSFSELKAGETFDSSQFYAEVVLDSSKYGSVLWLQEALSGNVTVVDVKEVGDRIYIVLKIDLGFLYCTISGTVEYEVRE